MFGQQTGWVHTGCTITKKMYPQPSVGKMHHLISFDSFNQAFLLSSMCDTSEL